METPFASRYRAGVRPSLLRLALSVLTGVLLAVFALETIHEVGELYPKIEQDYETRDFPAVPASDFAMFYTGAKNALRLDPQIYDIDNMVRSILIERGADPETLPEDIDTSTGWEQWQRYYNPPFYLLLFAPLTAFDLPTAYLVSIVLNLVGLAAFIVLMGVVMQWRQPQTVLMAAALIAYTPLYFTIQHSQPTPLICCLFLGGFLALRAGYRRLAAGMLVFTGMKPHVFPPSLSLLRIEPRLFLPMAVMGSLLLFGPFLLLGPGALVDYLQAVFSRGEGDLNDPAYAAALLSWTGFFNALTGEPQPLLWALASLATLGALGVILRRSADYLVLPGALLATILVLPHAHPQEWLLVFPALAILLSRDWPPLTLAAIGGLSLAVFAAANTWTTANATVLAGGTAVYWIAPTTFALLLFVAWLSLKEGDEDESPSRVRRDPAAAAGGWAPPAA